MVYKYFDKTFTGSGDTTHANKSVFNNESSLDMATQKLAREVHKTIIRKSKKKFILDNIWGADLADTQLISKFNKRFRFLLCVIDAFGKYAWVVPLKDKKGITTANAFQKILKESNKVKYGLTKQVNFTIVLLKNG